MTLLDCHDTFLYCYTQIATAFTLEGFSFWYGRIRFFPERYPWPLMGLPLFIIVKVIYKLCAVGWSIFWAEDIWALGGGVSVSGVEGDGG